MITSTKNPLIQRIRGLQTSADRKKQGVFLIEGEKEIRLAMQGGISIEIVACAPDLLAGNEVIFSEKAAREVFLSNAAIRLEAVSPEVFGKIAYRETTGGLLAIAKTPDHSLETLNLSLNPFVLAVESAEKPGNLGALLRTADAAGVDAVLVCDPTVDLYNPNVIRSSVGAIFTVRTVAVSSESAIRWLRDRTIQIVATSPAAQADYRSVDYRKPTALALGSEKEGLSNLWLQTGTLQVRIPMHGKMDSLNLSCSGAILMYEAERQRQSMAKPK